MEHSRSHTPPSDIESTAKKPRLDDGADVADTVVEASTSCAAPSNGTGSKKSTKRAQRMQRQRERERKVLPEACSSEDVLWHDVLDVVGRDYANGQIEAGTEFDTPFKYGDEVKVRIKSLGMGGVGVGIVEDGEALTSNGDADPDHLVKIARRKNWAVLVPFALPGELALARIYRSHRLHSVTDFIQIIEPTSSLLEVNQVSSSSLNRDNDLIRCRYFSKCGGCQFQMVPYHEQLAWKRTSIVRSYQRFSGLNLAGWDGSTAAPSLPAVTETIGSPLQYGYRTKLTPHFDKPPSNAKKIVAEERAQQQSKVQPEAGVTDSAGHDPEDVLTPSFLNIGFNKQGSKHVMDIEECSIATPVINEGMKDLRKTVARNILNYKKGASLLLRDSLEGTSDDSKHVCITEPNSTITERVGPMLFTYPASSFFQNNNAVLPELVGYVKDAIFPTMLADDAAAGSQRPTHLVDAYCGSGLFAISLAPRFEVVSGIELSSASIASAKKNTELNRTHPAPGSDSPPIPPSTSITFASGTAHTIFTSVSDFPRSQTALIIDPPRKGCDENFLQQLVKFGAGTVIYVSCNVVTQARDIGWVLGKDIGDQGDSSQPKKRYVVESLRGFDLFPQTAHVEGVAVLRLKDVAE